jgi:phage-related holin
MKIESNKTFLGFDSLFDFFNTSFGLPTIKTNIIASFIAVCTTFITGYIYNDAGAVYFMLFAIVCDYITGIARAIKSKTFSSRRMPRILITMMFYVMLLALSWNAAKYHMLFYFLPGLVYGGLIATILVSVLENVYYLGYLPKSLFTILQKRLLNKEEKDKEDKAKEEH